MKGKAGGCGAYVFGSGSRLCAADPDDCRIPHLSLHLMRTTSCRNQWQAESSALDQQERFGREEEKRGKSQRSIRRIIGAISLLTMTMKVMTALSFCSLPEGESELGTSISMMTKTKVGAEKSRKRGERPGGEFRSSVISYLRE
jgi:hypothetical protein